MAKLCTVLRDHFPRAMLALALILVLPMAYAQTSGHYASPEAAVAALVSAVTANEQTQLRAILGRQAGKLTRSGDPVADERSRTAFLKAYGEAHQIVHDGDRQATLMIGKDQWQLPFPLVKSAKGWRFDTVKGEQEILARRIGRNELAAIQVCLAIVDAEREYLTQDRDDNGTLEYAAKLVSTAGKRDGLYWPAKEGEPASPLGPLLAAAASEGYAGMAQTPYHGYFYRMLMSQGPDAQGGAYAYVSHGRMTGGFALIAYPARYGVSGIMSFMVNQDGLVYEKNLGKRTAAIAAKMTTFNPDSSWKRP